MTYKVTQSDLKGSIKDFPIEVVQKMVDKQVEQGNKANVKLFQQLCYRDCASGGFEWSKTLEGHDFWREVIHIKNFDAFFEKFPTRSQSVVRISISQFTGGLKLACQAWQRILVDKYGKNLLLNGYVDINQRQYEELVDAITTKEQEDYLDKVFGKNPFKPKTLSVLELQTDTSYICVTKPYEDCTVTLHEDAFILIRNPHGDVVETFMKECIGASKLEFIKK